MRLKPNEYKIIKNVLNEIFLAPKIYLFGSRLDDNKTGGDIDLYVISSISTFQKKLQAQAKLKRLLHKPIDIVLHKDFSRDIEQEALQGKLL